MANRSGRIHYPSLMGTGLRLVWALLQKRHLPFQLEARRVAANLQPPLVIENPENIPQSGPCVITMNHYARPAFRAWWISLAISAAVPSEVRWVMTAAWTSPNRWISWWWTPVTNWIFSRIAAGFGFFSMPPMPPDPKQVERRAKTVRQILSWAHAEMKKDGGSSLVLGLAPEGGDQPGGVLSLPPGGAGRFVWQLSHLGMEVVPVGVFVDERGLCLSFGERYLLAGGGIVDRDQLDLIVREEIMMHIAAQIPMDLRGIWGKTEN